MAAARSREQDTRWIYIAELRPSKGLVSSSVRMPMPIPSRRMGESDLLIISAVTRRSPSGRLEICPLLQMAQYGVYMLLRAVLFDAEDN